MTALRLDLGIIAGMVADGSRVLDVGCGDGALLKHLAESKGVDARGIELSQAGVNACVAHGLSVVQGDADRDLADYPDKAFDYVILGQTIQATRNPRQVLEQMARIGRRGIVSTPNFAHWRMRLQLLSGGRMPVTHALPHAWHDTPNIHMCSLRDFAELSRELGLTIERTVALRGAKARDVRPFSTAANILAEQAIFLLAAK
ncbi:Bifunctional methionine biosynthesis protein MetXA/MetW [Alphaproteobacteria bacterium SO-S41]|nr:Bifunctional methionine biosynthesis protein MetXA/MetW [Alphaproteobacteria bacterium SO-S41]